MLFTLVNLFILSPTDECQGLCLHNYPKSATTTTTFITNTIQNSETPNTIKNSETPVITKEKPGKLIDYLMNGRYHFTQNASIMEGNFNLFQRSVTFCQVMY